MGAGSAHAASTRYDVAIIGGGPAGLSAALTLSRAGKRSVVFDSGRPRNFRSRAAHGYLTRDDTAPSDLREIARGELEAYGLAAIRDARVLGIEQDGAGFTVDSTSGAVRVGFVVLAAGVVDELPDVPGLAEHWGRAVIHCPFCQGWEYRGHPWGLLALTDDDLTAAPRMLAWTDQLTLLTGRLDPAVATDAITAIDGIRIDARPVAAIESAGRSDGLAVRFGDGDTISVEALVLRPPQALASVVSSLDLRTTADGHVATDADGETSRPGIYAVGDVAGNHKAVIVAAASGLIAAQAVGHRLTLDSLDRHREKVSVGHPR